MKKILLAVLAAGSLVVVSSARADQAGMKSRDGYVLVFKDVPAGRGATQSLPFWVREDHGSAPYALTGREARRQRVIWKDVPHGRGQTQSLPFVVRE